MNSYSDIHSALGRNNHHEALQLAYIHLADYQRLARTNHTRDSLRNHDLWLAIADVVERTCDQRLIERFWQVIDQITPEINITSELPLMGVPILNGLEHLKALLNSIDYPVCHLAIVDNSTNYELNTNGSGMISNFLDALQQLGHPLVSHVHVARPFCNMGVATSWNHILSSFPELPFALIVNHDIVFSPGTIAQTIAQIDANKPQFMPLLSPHNQFSAFCITAMCWNRIGLFSNEFHYGYFEDLDFKDRILADGNIKWIDDKIIQSNMDAVNRIHSRTIKDDKHLEECNKLSYALNKLWYLSHRRQRNDRRGTWCRLWLSQWH